MAWLTTRIGRWLAALGAVLALLATVALVMFRRGQRSEAIKAAAANAKAAITAARVVQRNYTDAMKAASDVQQQQAKQPPPDVDKRDDLNNTF